MAFNISDSVGQQRSVSDKAVCMKSILRDAPLALPVDLVLREGDIFEFQRDADAEGYLPYVLIGRPLRDIQKHKVSDNCPVQRIGRL